MGEEGDQQYLLWPLGSPCVFPRDLERGVSDGAAETGKERRFLQPSWTLARSDFLKHWNHWLCFTTSPNFSPDTWEFLKGRNKGIIFTVKHF